MGFTNEHVVDRSIRVGLGIAMLALGWGGWVAGTPGTVLKFAGLVPLLTGIVGFCPLYRLCGLSTCRR